jgi:hypothetical protein
MVLNAGNPAGSVTALGTYGSLRPFRGEVTSFAATSIKGRTGGAQVTSRTGIAALGVTHLR